MTTATVSTLRHQRLHTKPVEVSLLAMASVNTPLKQNPLLEIQAADFLYGNE
jgi:hypothetical protein